MHRQNFLGLSSQEPNRVVSFPASQSLQVPTAPASSAISTGIPRLDRALSGPTTGHVSGPHATTKGLPRGRVTEAFGPPGVGKTSLALSVATNALQDGTGQANKVVWIDTGPPIPRPRLRAMLLKVFSTTSTSTSPSQTPEDLINNLIYIRTPTLPHLLSLLLRPPQNFPPPETTLLIVDSASALFPSYFPNPSEYRTRLAQSGMTDKGKIQWLVNRKWSVMGEIASHLVRLATTRRLAVLLLNQTHTRIRGQPRATLCPILAGSSWESAISTRIVMYRDFSPNRGYPSVHIAEVTKRSGRMLPRRLEENIIPFRVETDGLYEVDTRPSPVPAAAPAPAPEPEAVSSAGTQRKRKVDEVADSQDEDSGDEFGWTEGDDMRQLEGAK